MINAKILDAEYYQVNLCDSNLIGRKVNGVTISEHFYGKPTDTETVKTELRNATMINAIGNEAVKLVKEVKGELETVMIEDMPHLQFYTIKE